MSEHTASFDSSRDSGLLEIFRLIHLYDERQGESTASRRLQKKMRDIPIKSSQARLSRLNAHCYYEP